MSQVVITGYDIEIRRRLKTWIGDMMNPKLFFSLLFGFFGMNYWSKVR